MLYFADATGTLLVPVVRLARVEAKQVATAAMRELIVGPPPDLRRLVPADVNILSMQREGDMIIANVDRQPGGEQSLRAIALTLTEFPGVTRVQILVNGVPVGIGSNNAPIYRPVLNVDNPYGLPTTFESGTRFLPLYFLGTQGNYIRITRLVPETLETARKTVEELLAGPGQYSDILLRPIPAGTQLREIAKGENNSVIVDLSHHFASADNRDAALQTLVLSLTELRGSGSTPIFRRVQVRIEGRALSEYWGNGYTGPFERVLLNAE
jgi:spore germination protein GerM